MQQHVSKGVAMLEPVGGSLRRVIPIVLSHHDKFDGSGYHPNRGDEIPLEARIISVADVYDSLTSDRPYRKAMSPFDAKEIIVNGAGKDFDPRVVTAFVDAFRRGELEVPTVVV
jgi:HD-GYP domain-containing protein (c-di-GMP phosphodiesterase class II)